MPESESGAVQPNHQQTVVYLEGQGDLVSRLQMGVIRVTIRVIRVTKLLTKSL